MPIVSRQAGPAASSLPCHDPKRGLRRPVELAREIVKAGLVEVPLGTQAHDLALDLNTPAKHQAHALNPAGCYSIVRLLSHGAYRREKSATVQHSNFSAKNRRRCRACRGTACNVCMEWSAALGEWPHDVLGPDLTEPQIDVALQARTHQPTGHDHGWHVENCQGHGHHEDER